MGKVLTFPKDKAQRVSSLQRSESKRLFYSLSIFSVIVMAVVIAEKLSSLHRPQYILAVNYDKNFQQNRAIASQDQVEIVENIRWGQGIVEKINQSGLHRVPAAVGLMPRKFDQLRYGELAGKYRLTSNQDHKISEIEYVESDNAADVPIRIRQRDDFLVQYKDLLSVSFSQLEVESTSAEKEVYKLLNKNGDAIGKVSFQLDPGGRFLSLKVEDISQ